MFYSTKQVANRLGIQPDLLSRAIWLGKVEAPAKSPSGGFLWTEKDIERAAWALHRHTRLGGNNGK